MIRDPKESNAKHSVQMKNGNAVVNFSLKQHS